MRTDGAQQRPAAVPCQTKGEGDCAFHAALGTYHAETAQFEVDDVAGKRQAFSDAIRGSLENSRLFPLISAAIQEHLRSERASAVCAELAHDYEVCLQAAEDKAQEQWSAFEGELSQYPQFLENIDQHTESYIQSRDLSDAEVEKFKTNAKLRFDTCLNAASSGLKEAIQASSLSTAFREFEGGIERFDWDHRIDQRVLNEYADFIAKQGNWLLPCELQLLAHVFNLRVTFQNVKAEPEIYHPSGEKAVEIYFNGVNHFQRVSSEATFPASALSPQATRPALVGSDPYSLSEEMKVWRLVEESRHRLVEAEGKRLVLLVGHTGAGKSTLVNYLNGSELERKRLPDQLKGKGKGKRCLQVKEGQRVYAEIGHGARRSKTLHPQAIPAVFSGEVSAQAKSLAYIDLPGTSDAHLEKAERLCASIALPMAIHHAETISGIVVVIDIQSLAARGKSFSDFTNLLGGLLDPGTLVEKKASDSPLMFVFTHVNREEYEEVSDVLSYIQDFKEECIEELQEIIQEFMVNLQAIAEKLGRSDELNLILQSLQGLGQDRKVAPEANAAFLETTKKLLKEYEPLSEGDETFRIAQSNYDSLEKVYYQLMALGILLKYADSPDNQFIIHGDRSDDIEGLRTHIQRLAIASAIDKKHFVFKGRAEAEWLQLGDLLQQTAEKADVLKQTLTECPEEIKALKKYRDFLKQRLQDYQRMLDRLNILQQTNLGFLDRLIKSSTVNQSVDSILAELEGLDNQLLSYANENLAKRKEEHDKVKRDLAGLDTQEPTRYLHPSLGPVDLSPSTFRQVAGGLATLVSFPLILPAGIFFRLDRMLGGSIVRRMKYDGPSLLIRVPVAIIWGLVATSAATLLCAERMNYVPYTFRYDDLPFIAVELSPNETLVSIIGKSILMGFFGFDEGEKGRFFIDTQLKEPENGVFKISGLFCCSDVHIKLFVEKRIHPDIKPQIARLKRKIEGFEQANSRYFEEHILHHEENHRELESICDQVDKASDQKSSLIELLQKRVERYERYINQLSGYLRGYESVVRDAHFNWHADVLPFLDVMSSIQSLLNREQAFVTQFLDEAKAFSTDSALKAVTHPLTLWGRKATPTKRIEYTASDTKPAGSSIGAVYSPLDKPAARWMGKLGMRELAEDELPGTEGTRVYHGRAVEAVKEKLGADLFALLSEGRYGVPKTRLAEIDLGSVKSFFKNPNDYMEFVLQRVNSERTDDFVNHGIFVMSKFWPDYQDLHDLKACIHGEEALSFLECLKASKLPEFAFFEGKKLPIRGLMELLAIGRLLGDSDVLGVSGKNAGFVIERDIKNSPSCVRVVKIDPGYVFDFTESNVFRSEVVDELETASLKRDPRNIQYAVNPGCLLPWVSLSEEQQQTYLQAFQHGLQKLDQRAFLNLVFDREGIRSTPSGKRLRFFDTFTQNIIEPYQTYLTSQKKIFSLELKQYAQLRSENSFAQLAQQYGLYAQKQEAQGVSQISSSGLSAAESLSLA